MSLLIFIIGILISLAFAYYTTRDLMSPAVIYCLPWTESAIILLLSDFQYDRNSLCFFYLLIGAFIFLGGYYLGHNKIKWNERFGDSKVLYICNIRVLRILVNIEILLYVFITIVMFRFIRSQNGINYFLAYYMNRADFSFGVLVGTLRDVIMGIGLSIVVAYFYIPEYQKPKYKKILILQLGVYFVMAALRMTRNGILFSLVPLFFVYLMLFKKSNKTVVKILFFALLAFLLYFIYFATLKYWTAFQTGNFIDNIKFQIELYASGSLIAFQKIFDDHIPSLAGKNTFRFLLQIVDAILGTEFDPGIVQSYVRLSRNATVNVYTVYQFYAYDFGWIYALFVIFFLGVWHGRTYKKAVLKRPNSVIFYALSIYPLVMQFFQDQYFSIIGSWIKVVFGMLLILNTRFVFRRYKAE